MYVQRILIVVALVICFISVLPLIRKDSWVFRVFEFPRVQKWWINLVCLAAIGSYYYFYKDSHPYYPYLLGMLVANQLYLSSLIFPFTFFAKRQMLTTKDDALPRVTVFISNVYQDNRKEKRLLKLVESCKADILLLVETDEWWQNVCLDAFGDNYPHRVLIPQDNTYGMLLFSKFELRETKVRHLIKDDVPSISTLVRHPKGGYFRLYALHPEPPVPTENSTSTERDAEILTVGKEAAKEKLPVVVAGDLNDVAWSYSTELFLKISGLLDPRRGRGLYSTFHARYPFMRWPLDHVFCSAHFHLNRLKILSYICSDHFPVFIDLSIANYKSDDQEGLESDQEDVELAEEKIEAAK